MRGRGRGRLARCCWRLVVGGLLLSGPARVLAQPESDQPSSPRFALEDPWVGVAMGPAVPLGGGAALARFSLLGGAALPFEHPDVGLDLVIPFTFSRTRDSFLGMEFGLTMMSLGAGVQAHLRTVPVVVPYGSFGLGLTRFGVWFSETFQGYSKQSLVGLNVRLTLGVAYPATQDLLITFEPMVVNLYLASAGQAGVAGGSEWVVNFGARYLIP